VVRDAFLPIAFIGYLLFGRVPGALRLVAASLVFYGWWNPACLPLSAISMGGNDLCRC